MHRRRLLLVVVLTGALVRAAAGQPQQQQQTQEETGQPVSLHEHLYQAALAIRRQANPSWREQVRCVEELLVPAADVQPAGASDAAEHAASPATPIPGYPELEIGPGTHPGALRELAKALMDGFGCEPDARLALELFRHAASAGDAEAQGQMGLRLALGLQDGDSWDEEGIVWFGEPDEPTALLHLHFAAAGGDALARMALGHMHLSGLGVPKSCHTAVAFYLPVAEQVADLAGSTDGRGLPHIERLRLSVHYQQGGRADHQKEVVQYYQDSADKGNVDAQTTVGQVLSYGTHGVERDHAAALSYLRRAVEAGDAQAMAHLGHMLANGVVGGEPDLAAARKHFLAAAKQGNPSAQYGLAYMYLVGKGAEQDYAKAFDLFSEAAAQGHADAHFYLGVMHLQGLGLPRRSPQRAFSCFSLAAHAGNVQAMHTAALLQLTGQGTSRSCRPAAGLLKMAAERGPAGEVLQRGHEAFFQGRYAAALWDYLQASVVGLELGQSNAAWLLDQGYVRAGGAVHNLTFTLHQRSAAQGNVASLLALGDAYFYGRGTPQDWSRASAIYYEAYQEHSPEAMFNLGFMHEFGAGVPKDLSLAARFYAMAAHTSSDALLAAACARVWLTAHRVWEWVRPLLPAAYAPLYDHVWALKPPHTSVLGSWTAVAAGLLPSQAVLQLELGAWRWLDALGVTSLLQALVDAKDFGETAVLLALTTALFLVLRVRRQRVDRAAQALAAAAAAGGGWGGEAAGRGGGGITDAQMAALQADIDEIERLQRQHQRAAANGDPAGVQGPAVENGHVAEGVEGVGAAGLQEQRVQRRSMQGAQPFGVAGGGESGESSNQPGEGGSSSGPA